VVAPRPCQQGGCARRRVVSIDSGRLTHRIRGFRGRWARTPSGHTGGLGYCGDSATGRRAGAPWGLEEIGIIDTDRLSDIRRLEKLLRRPEGDGEDQAIRNRYVSPKSRQPTCGARTCTGARCQAPAVRDRDRNRESEDAEPAGRLRGARIGAEERKSRRQRRRAEE